VEGDQPGPEHQVAGPSARRARRRTVPLDRRDPQHLWQIRSATRVRTAELPLGLDVSPEPSGQSDSPPELSRVLPD